MAYRPTEKTEARKKAQHQLLIETAMKLVTEGGFKTLTIAILAERADVAVGTVYKYFASKAELCAEVFRIATQKEVNQVKLAAFPEQNEQIERFETCCKKRLYRALEIFSQRAIAGKRLAYALIAEPVDAMIQQERLKYRRAYMNIFQTLIQEGIDNREFPAQDAWISAAALVGALAEALLGAIVLGGASPEQGLEDESISDILEFCLAGVCRS